MFENLITLKENQVISGQGCVWMISNEPIIKGNYILDRRSSAIIMVDDVLDDEHVSLIHRMIGIEIGVNMRYLYNLKQV